MRCSEARPELAALSELDAEARANVEGHLSSCADCRVDLAEIQTTIHLLERNAVEQPPGHLRASVLGAVEAAGLASALQIAVEAPRSALKESVMRAVERDRRAEGAAGDVVDIRSRRLRIARSLGVAATLLILGVGIGQAISNDDVAPPEIANGMPEGHETQTLLLEGMGPGELEVRHYRHDNFRLTLSVEGFEPTPAGFHYAVWVRGSSGDVAIGTFRLKRLDDFNIPFALGVNPSDFPDLVITLEPNDGEPDLEGEIITEGSFDLDAVHHGTYDD